MRLAIAPLVFFVALGGDAAFAQDDAPAPARRSRVEIGGTFDFLAVVSPLGGGGMRNANLRATFPLRGRFSLDSHFAIPEHVGQTYWGLYGVQVRQRLRRATDPSTELFVTYGGLGFYEHSTGFEWRSTLNGREEVYRAPSHTMVTLPLFPTAGIGVTKRFAKGLAWRADGDVLGLIYPPIIGYRLSIGVVVAVGGER